ncbi:protein of unknown function [Paraburkholderia kururiensis]
MHTALITAPHAFFPDSLTDFERRASKTRPGAVLRRSPIFRKPCRHACAGYPRIAQR